MRYHLGAFLFLSLLFAPGAGALTIDQVVGEWKVDDAVLTDSIDAQCKDAGMPEGARKHWLSFFVGSCGYKHMVITKSQWVEKTQGVRGKTAWTMTIAKFTSTGPTSGVLLLRDDSDGSDHEERLFLTADGHVEWENPHMNMAAREGDPVTHLRVPLKKVQAAASPPKTAP